MNRVGRFLVARRRKLEDIQFRLQAAGRRLSGKSTVHAAGCRWTVTTANTQKSISLMLRSNPVMERLLSQIREDDVFADIGANMGLYSIRVATHEPAPRMVYAFEPAPAPYLTLLKNIKLNGCEDTCCPMPTLIGADLGFVEFSMHSLDPSDGTGHVAVGDERPTLPTGHLWAPLPVTTKVPIVSISELVRTGVI